MADLFVAKVRTLSQSSFLKNNLVFFIGTLLISVFNYLYYPVMGRLLSVPDFGELQAVISIFMQLGIILTAFGYVITNVTNNTEQSKEREHLVIKLEQITLAICIVVFLLLIVLSVMLGTSLQFTSIVPLILVGFLVILNVPTTSRMYFMQGMKQLTQVSITGILFAAGKLIFSCVLVLMGAGIAGAMWGYVIALFIALVYIVKKTENIYPSLFESLLANYISNIKTWRLIKDDLVYGFAILVLLSGVTLLYSTDTIVIRLFFDPVESGLYSAVSSIARIVFFVTASVAGVLLATIKIKSSYNNNLLVLYRSFLIINILGGIVLFLFILFPTQSISVLFGSRYDGVAHLLPLLSLVMLFCSYNNLLVCFEIALRRFVAIYVVAAGIVVGSLFVWARHSSFEDIILGYLAANILVFVLLSIQIVMRKWNA